VDLVEENSDAKPQYQPVAMGLIELAEPIILQRNGQRHFPADDRNNGNGDVGEIAIKT